MKKYTTTVILVFLCFGLNAQGNNQNNKQKEYSIITALLEKNGLVQVN